MTHVFCKEGLRVKDIPGDYLLITDSQDIQAIKEYLGSPKWFDYNCLFVKVIEGDYFPVIYALEGSIPYLERKTDMIYLVRSSGDPLCPQGMM